VAESTRDRVLQAVRSLSDARGYPPTVREIGRELGLASPSTVHQHLLSLRRDGLVAWEPAFPRTLRVLAP